ncbi:MAG: hypothetical protein IJQ80_08310, partial [Clostridia bacterium]|nr:hypothetical protein [Clostridia bacterium]
PVRGDVTYYPTFSVIPALHEGDNLLTLERRVNKTCQFVPQKSGYYRFRTSGDEVSPECSIRNGNGDHIEKINYQFSYDAHLNIEFMSWLEAGETYCVDIIGMRKSGTVTLYVRNVEMHTVHNDKYCDHGMVGYPDEEDSYMLCTGEIISPDVTPDEGYGLLELFVTDADGNRLLENNDRMYVMPDSDVDITATFAPAHGIMYDITEYVVGFNGNRSVMWYCEGDYEDCAAQGAGVEYFFEWDENYALDELTITTESGETVPYGKVMPYMNRAEIWFTMPDEPICVTVHVLPTRDLVFAPGEGKGITLTTAVKEGQEISLPEFMFSAPEGMEFAGWSVDDGDGEPVVKAAGEALTVTENVTVTATFSEIQVVPGDANGDGKFNSKDLSLLKRIVAGTAEDGTYNAANADVNGDGKYTNKDVAALKRIIAGA